jgi:L-ornithine N5-monooxygenase
VRLELIEHLYERMYNHRREYGIDERAWPHRILGGCRIADVQPLSDDEESGFQIRVQKFGQLDESADLTDGFVRPDLQEEVFEADLIIAATGYQRNAHVSLLEGAWPLLPQSGDGTTVIDGWMVNGDEKSRMLQVGRDYRVRFEPGMVAEDSGVWLQGCCEGTHGVSPATVYTIAIY